MKKTIALLTFHHKNNYGAVLQTYATIKYIESLGYSVRLIDLRRKPNLKYVSILYERVFNRNFYRFRQTYFTPISTERIHAGQNDAIFNAIADTDIVLVGSDQVWRPEFTKSFGLNYFLDFARGKVRVSYASSFGRSDWPHSTELSNSMRTELLAFKSISVREVSAVEICNNIFNVKAEQVVDPTLLVPINTYETLISGNLPNDNVCSFFLDKKTPFKKNLLKYLSDVGNKNIVDISIPRINLLGLSLEVFPLKVGRWLKELYGSKAVITDSFHCVVFSILFKKPFVCIANPHRGLARLESFLGQLGLENRFVKEINSEDNYLDIYELLTTDIEWKQIDILLTKNIERSQQFLSDSIHN